MLEVSYLMLMGISVMRRLNRMPGMLMLLT